MEWDYGDLFLKPFTITTNIFWCLKFVCRFMHNNVPHSGVPFKKPVTYSILYSSFVSPLLVGIYPVEHISTDTMSNGFYESNMLIRPEDECLELFAIRKFTQDRTH